MSYYYYNYDLDYEKQKENYGFDFKENLWVIYIDKHRRDPKERVITIKGNFKFIVSFTDEDDYYIKKRKFIMKRQNRIYFKYLEDALKCKIEINVTKSKLNDIFKNEDTICNKIKKNNFSCYKFNLINEKLNYDLFHVNFWFKKEKYKIHDDRYIYLSYDNKPKIINNVEELKKCDKFLRFDYKNYYLCNISYDDDYTFEKMKKGKIKIKKILINLFNKP